MVITTAEKSFSSLVMPVVMPLSLIHIWYSDGSFRPYNYITRAEAAKLMNAILGRETSNFVWSLREWDDVLPEAWYYLDVLAATTGEIRS